MADPVLDGLQPVLAALAGQGEPGRVLQLAADGALRATRATAAAVVGRVDGVMVILASAGVPGSDAMLAAAKAATERGRISRRLDRESGLSVVAEPLRIGPRAVGALVVAGTPRALQTVSLLLFADAAAVAVGHRPSPLASGTSAAELLGGVADAVADPEHATFAGRVLDAAERLVGATAGFLVVVDGTAPGRLTVAHQRGYDREQIRAACQDPAFRDLLLGYQMTSTTWPAAGEPTPPVGSGAPGGEKNLVVPLAVAGRHLGCLVLALAVEPDPSARALIQALGRHVAIALRSAEQAKRLAERDGQFTVLAHAVSEAVVVVDSGGCFELINGPAAELFHLSTALELGQPAKGRLGDAVVGELLADDGDRTVEAFLGRQDPRAYRATMRHLFDRHRNSTGRLLLFHDLATERRANQLMADFIAVIGHELRTPLTVVLGYSNTLVNRWDKLSDASRSAALESLATNANRLHRLIDDLLLVAGLEDGEPRVQVQPVDVAALVGALDLKRVKIRRPNEPVIVHIDRSKFEQVLIHLVDNALKFSTGEVAVDVVVRMGEVEVTVADQGPGIFSGDIPQLFERFRQLDGTSTRAHGGTGIGLYLCRRLVEAQGGRIWCESRMGVGSRFIFAVPARQPEAAALTTG